MQKLVSILIPCRNNRPELIRDALQSLVEKTTKKERLEVIIKIDKDDIKTMQVACEYKNKLDLKTVMLDGAMGRAGLAGYTNELAKISKGNLIWWWSDEIRMMTNDWDSMLVPYGSYYDKFALLFPPWGNIAGDAYPMITRKWLETTGRFAFHPAIDTCVEEIQKALSDKIGRYNLAGIEIKDVSFTGEAIVPENKDVLINFNDEIVQKELQIDINKIKLC
jgi:cellulose synthase/poly-beta-1,6-N-acetylglucosamine synthase-like glycosyltransferase